MNVARSVPRRPAAAGVLIPILVLLAALAAPAASPAAPRQGQPARAAADSVLDRRHQPVREVPGGVRGRCECELVLVHGLGSSAAVWDEVVPYLRSCEVWTYELPGHGATPPQSGLTLAAAAEDLGRFIAENDILQPSLVGHAMGGLIAMRHALDHQDEVKRLIIIDAAPRQLATPDQKLRITDGLTRDYDRFVASLYLSMSPHEEITDRLVDQALRTDSASFITLLMSSFDFDMTEELSRQIVPILVIGSALFFPDAQTVRPTLDRMGYMQARTVAFKRMGETGHFPMLERPAYLASVIQAYVLLGE